MLFINSAAFALLFSCSELFWTASAGLFLGKLTQTELKRVLLAEIEAAIGSNLKDVPEKRIHELEDALRPIFDVLPKNDEGKLDHDGVRYLLKRTFVSQHGWFVNGLQSENEAWNSSQVGATAHLPELIQELFEKRVGDQGSNLNEVVALAATMEHLIRDELRGKLETIYSAKSIGYITGVSKSEGVKIIELYMAFFLRGHDAVGWTESSLEYLRQNFYKQFRAWPELKLLIGEVVEEMEEKDHSFDDIASILEIVANRFPSFYETQCNGMKSAMIDLEDRRSGRVRLVDFYSMALEDGFYQFSESIDVLRSFGVLDEVDPDTPRVIIPNYIGGQSNCVARTDFYSTCCASTCETLLNNIERSLGKSEATPDELDSKTLTPWLRNRLEDLANHHNGNIPLHGRLFAQWMHFAHPRDCMYPHTSGTVSKLRYDDWEKQTGLTSGLTVPKMQEHHAALRLTSRDREENAAHHEHVGMWSMEEELFVEGTAGRKANRGFSSRVALYPAAAFVLFLIGFHLYSSFQEDGEKKSTYRMAAMDKFV